MAGIESMIVDEKPSLQKPVDREKVFLIIFCSIACTMLPMMFLFIQTCPLLLRVFCSTGRHHSANEFGHGNVPSNELQIYTWQDATLQE